MTSENQTNHKETEHKKLLEEIRRKAEEAELKRIEEEEQKASVEGSGPSVNERKKETGAEIRQTGEEKRKPDSEHTSMPRWHIQTAGSEKSSGKDRTILELRERVAIALDRRKVDKASQLVTELSALTPETPELENFRARIKVLQEEEQLSKARSATSQKNARRESEQKKIAELLATATTFYEQEKYEKGISSVREALVLDQGNEEALQLQRNIEKARRLAEQVNKEEAKRKAEAITIAPSSEPSVSKQPADDVWGGTPIAHGDVGYDIKPEQTFPVGPPKPPLYNRIATGTSKLRTLVKPVAIVLVIVLVVAVAYFAFNHLRSTVFPTTYSLLVFPATYDATNSSEEYLADGLTEELISRLSILSDLRVIAPTSARSLRGSSGGDSRIARGLGVEYYLHWSVSWTSETVALQLKFLDTLSSEPIWESKIETSLRELPAVVIEVARALVDKMEITLNSQEQVAFRRVPTKEAQAYDAYLQGRFMLGHPGRYALRRSTEAFERSARSDTLFADAYVAAAWCDLLAFDTEADLSSTPINSAAMNIRHALRLGAGTSEALRVRAMVEQFRSEYDKGLDYLQQAVNVTPDDAESQRRLSVAYLIKNRADDALKSAFRAVSADPYNEASYTNLALVQQYRGDYDGALQSYEIGMRYASDPNEYRSGYYADILVYLQEHDRAAETLNDRIARSRRNYVDYYRLGRIYSAAGKPLQQWGAVFERAKELLENRLVKNPDNAVDLSYLALVYTRLGKYNDAVPTNTRAQLIAPNNLDVLYNTARMYALQKENNQALEYLGRAVDRKYRLATILDMDFYNLRANPGFLQTITR
jgi:tetratricopeptide (TPR) repeat protein